MSDCLHSRGPKCVCYGDPSEDLTPAPAKPKRKPPQFDPLSPHSVRLACVSRLVSQEALKKPGAWGRELHILKRLQAQYSDESFWLTLSPADKLDSLAYFLAPFGAAQLREHWNLHQYAAAQENQIAIDRASSSDMMDSGANTVAEADLPVVKPRETPVSWADSE